MRGEIRNFVPDSIVSKILRKRGFGSQKATSSPTRNPPEEQTVKPLEVPIPKMGVKGKRINSWAIVFLHWKAGNCCTFIGKYFHNSVFDAIHTGSSTQYVRR